MSFFFFLQHAATSLKLRSFLLSFSVVCTGNSRSINEEYLQKYSRQQHFITFHFRLLLRPGFKEKKKSVADVVQAGSNTGRWGQKGVLIYCIFCFWRHLKAFVEFVFFHLPFFFFLEIGFTRRQAVSLHLWMKSMWLASRTAGSFSTAPADICSWFVQQNPGAGRGAVVEMGWERLVGKRERRRRGGGGGGF